MATGRLRVKRKGSKTRRNYPQAVEKPKSRFSPLHAEKFVLFAQDVIRGKVQQPLGSKWVKPLEAKMFKGVSILLEGVSPKKVRQIQNQLITTKNSIPKIAQQTNSTKEQTRSLYYVLKARNVPMHERYMPRAVRAVRPETKRKKKRIERLLVSTKKSLLQIARETHSGKKTVRKVYNRLESEGVQMAKRAQKIITPQEIKKIESQLISTSKSLGQIAKEMKLSDMPVGKVYHQLKEQGVQMAERAFPMQRDKRRKTNFFSGKDIKRILTEQSNAVKKTAGRFYKAYKHYFDAASMGPNDIAQNVMFSLDWKLQTFNPKKIGGKNIEEKIERYCRYHLKRLSIDQKRRVEKKYRKAAKQYSADQALTKKGTKPFRKKDIISGVINLPMSPEKKILALEAIAKKAGLTPREKAVVYGRAVEIPQRRMGEIFGLNESYISQVVKAARQKIKKAGIAV